MNTQHQFRSGDHIRRISTEHHAGTGAYGDQECVQGSTGVVMDYYPYKDYDEDHDGHVLNVTWDDGNNSAINEEDLDFELPDVTPDEEAAVIQSILKGARHG